MNTPPKITKNLTSQIQAIQYGGQPQSKSERAYFEPRFGADFSQVRLHSDTQAAESARALNAKAYTLGTGCCVRDWTGYIRDKRGAKADGT